MKDIPADEIPDREEYLKTLYLIDNHIKYLKRIDYDTIWESIFKTLDKITPAIELIVDYLQYKKGYEKEPLNHFFKIHKTFDELYNCPVLPVLFNPECFMDYVNFILLFLSEIIEEEIKRITNCPHYIYSCVINDSPMYTCCKSKMGDIIGEESTGHWLIYNYSLTNMKQINKELEKWVEWRSKNEG